MKEENFPSDHKEATKTKAERLEGTTTDTHMMQLTGELQVHPNDNCNPVTIEETTNISTGSK